MLFRSDELTKVLKRSKLDRYVSAQDRKNFLAVILRNARRAFLSSEERDTARGACRDSKDEELLSLSLAVRAHFLISSDEDLLILNPWQNISILKPAEFLSQISSQPAQRE